MKPLLPILQLPGVIGAFIMDAESGSVLNQVGLVSLELELVAVGIASVLLEGHCRAQGMGLNRTGENVLITMDSECHILHPLCGKEGTGLYLYVALVKSVADVATCQQVIKKVALNWVI